MILMSKIALLAIFIFLQSSTAEDEGFSGTGPNMDLESDDAEEALPVVPSAVSVTVSVAERGSGIDIDDEKSSRGTNLDDEDASDLNVDEGSASDSQAGPCLDKQRRYQTLGKRIRFRCDENGDYSPLQECKQGKCRCVDPKTGRKTRQKYVARLHTCIDKVERPYDHTGEVEKRDDPPKKQKRQSLLMSDPGLFAGIIGGAVVGLLILILLVMFVVYRMRKKDEGSYALEKKKKLTPLPTHPYQPCPQEYYA